MTVAFDAVTQSSSWLNTPDPFTFSHTPSGTPAGVCVIVSAGGAGDFITGITYGGVAMTRTANGYATDGLGETCSAYAYFLGSGVPTGTQTVSVDHTATTAAKMATCYTVTAGGNTEVVATGKLEGDIADPQIALDSGSATAIRFFGLGSGHNSEANLTVISGMTAVGGGTNGGKCWRGDRETTPTSGSVTVGYTATSEDCGMVAIAVAEVAAAGGSLVGFMASLGTGA